jgi:SAM-dependent methyltransferase
VRISVAESTGAEWWKSYFSSNYGVLYRGPLAEELETDAEVRAVKRVFAQAEGPVLDLGCGFGRHLVPSRRGKVQAVGLDWSEDLLRSVPKAHRGAVVRGDMRAIPLEDATLSGAYIFFNTFGYFEDGDNGVVLRELARVLRPGAKLLMDLPVRAGMRHAAAAMPAAVRCQGDCSIYENWSYDDETKRLNAWGAWEIDGEKQDWKLSLRLYTPVEVRRLLRQAGFQGEAEIRPLEELDQIGRNPAPADYPASYWRNKTNMIILVSR